MRRSSFVPVLLGLALANPAGAQIGPPTQSALSLSGDCDIDAIALTVEVVISATMNEDITAFDLQRRAFGSCAPAASILDAPFSRGAVGMHQYFLEDGPLVEGILYEYEVVPIDDTGTRVPAGAIDPAGEDLQPYLYEHCGSSPPSLGTGVLETSGFGPGLFVPCPESCGEEFLFATNFSRECGELIGSGSEIEVFGFFASFESYGPLFWSTECVPSSCASVATSASSWGTLKSRYR